MINKADFTFNNEPKYWCIKHNPYFSFNDGIKFQVYAFAFTPF